MIAGEHARGDTRSKAVRDGSCRLYSGRVEDASEAEEGEVPLKLIARK